MSHLSETDATMYDKEFYTDLSNVAGLIRLGFLIGSGVMAVFMVMIGSGASQEGFEITRGMILFYAMLSYSTGFGFLVMLFFLEHPNKWVTRVFILVMFSVPLVLKYL